MEQIANQQNPPLKIILIRTSSIGDIVLATAASEYARAWGETHQRQISVHWITKSGFQMLPDSSGNHVMVHDVDAVSAGTDATLPTEIDAIVDLQGTLRSRRLSRKLAKRFIAPVTRSRKEYFARLLHVVAAKILGRSKNSSSVQQRIDRWLPPRPQYRLAVDAMAKAVGVVPELVAAARPKLFASAIDSRLTPDTLWLALAPGAAHEAKKAPAQTFERILAAMLSGLGDAPAPGIVLLGSAAEVPDCKELERRILANCWEAPVLNLGGSTGLDNILPILAGCRALLGNDSSLGHIAESLGVPAVVLFGPTSESFGFGPHRADSKAVSTPIGCRPCSKHGKATCRYGDQACFTKLDTNDAGRHLARLLTPELSPSGGSAHGPT